MEHNDEIQYDAPHFFRVYKSGRVERFFGTEVTPPGVEPSTGVSSKDLVIVPDVGVSARLYLPKLTGESQGKLPILVYYHGGGFCMGTAFNLTFHSYLNSLVAQANVIAVSVEYRLAPEHPLPAAYDDSWEALRWVVSHANGGEEPWLANHADFGRVFLGGDSAGANIAHHMALRAGRAWLECAARINGLVVIHPYFHGTEPVESEKIDPTMSASLGGLWKLVCPSSTGIDDPWINPVVDGAPSLKGLGCKRVLLCVAEKDVLRDRGRAYYKELNRSGWEGEVELFESEGEDHTFHLLDPTCEKALALHRAVSRYLNRD